MDMNMIIDLSFVFFISLFLGSFYNVVALRTLKGEGFALPPSSCPVCNHRLGPLDLFPVLSYVFLGGKCRHCKTKISKIYPLGELFTGVAYTVVAYKHGLVFSLDMLTQVIFITFMIITTISDMKEKMIPDRFIVAGLLSVFLLRTINQAQLISYLAQGILSFLALFTIFALSNGKMGGADVKIYALIGLSIGFIGAMQSLFYASIVALVFNLDKLVIKDRRKTEIPFFPFITIGVLLVYII